MSPVYIKGGTWTNVEDQILTAAIAKYGLTQWARCSSLLANKSPKQCKQRWSEWLDPRIKTTGWTAAEDERLLKLIKQRPNQWNSVGILMSRSVNQCIERYQQLLTGGDQGSGEGGSDLGMVGTFMAQNGLGTINMDPESQPARPDMEQLGDDEQEMLSEAKARLANTQGKRAKRKARERMLAESRRIALIQRRRELKQAGINRRLTGTTKKRYATQMDYNADIAFERAPQEGPFDTAEEDADNGQEKAKYERLLAKGRAGTSLNEEGARQRRGAKKQAKEQKRWNEVTVGASEEIYDRPEKRPKLMLSGIDDEKEVEEGDVDSRLARAAEEIHARENQKSILFTKESAHSVEADRTDRSTEASKTNSHRRHQDKKRRKALAKMLNSLPEPLNDYVLEVPEASQEPAREPDEPNTEPNDEPNYEPTYVSKPKWVSQAVLRGLPIPRPVNNAGVLDEIEKEMNRLIDRDYKVHVLGEPESAVDSPEEDSTTSTNQAISADILKAVRDAAENGLGASMEASRDILAGSTMKPRVLVELIKKETSVSSALESALQVRTGGYEAEAGKLVEELTKRRQKIAQLDHEEATYRRAALEEQEAIQERASALQNGIDEMAQAIAESRERLAQP